jgi:hypothetical protein
MTGIGRTPLMVFAGLAVLPSARPLQAQACRVKDINPGPAN